jgi:hypothetical protein
MGVVGYRMISQGLDAIGLHWEIGVSGDDVIVQVGYNRAHRLRLGAAERDQVIHAWADAERQAGEGATP